MNQSFPRLHITQTHTSTQQSRYTFWDSLIPNANAITWNHYTIAVHNVFLLIIPRLGSASAGECCVVIRPIWKLTVMNTNYDNTKPAAVAVNFTVEFDNWTLNVSFFIWRNRMQFNRMSHRKCCDCYYQHIANVITCHQIKPFRINLFTIHSDSDRSGAPNTLAGWVIRRSVFTLAQFRNFARILNDGNTCDSRRKRERKKKKMKNETIVAPQTRMGHVAANAHTLTFDNWVRMRCECVYDFHCFNISANLILDVVNPPHIAATMRVRSTINLHFSVPHSEHRHL